MKRNKYLLAVAVLVLVTAALAVAPAAVESVTPATPRFYLRGTLLGYSPSTTGCFAGLQLLDGQRVTVFAGDALNCNGLYQGAVGGRQARLQVAALTMFSPPDYFLIAPLVEQVRLY